MLKLKKFILSNKNITGLSLSMICIMLGLIGFLNSLWIPIAFIAYIIGYVVCPEEKSIKFYHMKDENLQDYIGFITKIKETIDMSQKLPTDAKKLINSINTVAIELLKFLSEQENFDEYSEDVANFKNIFSSYLPKLINQYEKLPLKYATEIKTSNGITAKDMLIEQLKLLEQKVTEISYGMYENDLTALKVNGRFLKDKFENKNYLNVNS